VAKLIDSIDQLGRPLLRLPLAGGRDDLLALVYTGFNGELMASLDMARLVRSTLDADMEPIELGTGTVERVYVGRIDIRWLERQTRVEVLVSSRWPAPKADAPVALIGTRLLRPHLLMIDFAADTLEIETQG
jgi:predicted aspartyl protease